MRQPGCSRFLSRLEHTCSTRAQQEECSIYCTWLHQSVVFEHLKALLIYFNPLFLYLIEVRSYWQLTLQKAIGFVVVCLFWPCSVIDMKHDSMRMKAHMYFQSDGIVGIYSISQLSHTVDVARIDCCCRNESTGRVWELHSYYWLLDAHWWLIVRVPSMALVWALLSFISRWIVSRFGQLKLIVGVWLSLTLSDPVMPLLWMNPIPPLPLLF